MDLVQGARFMKNKKPQLFQLMKTMIGQLSIDDIQDFKAHGVKGVENVMSIDRITKHDLIRPFNRYRYQEVLFLSVARLLNRSNLQINQQYKIADIRKILQEQMGIYSHKWQEGDMLIWDNLQVMHTASGKFQGIRLLYRTQGDKKN